MTVPPTRKDKPVSRYRKKPVVIEAMQWDGTASGATPIIDWVLAGGGAATYHDNWDLKVGPYDGSPVVADVLHITTLEGVMLARDGDWIIRGVQGEHYPCKPDIFNATYDLVVEGQTL